MRNPMPPPVATPSALLGRTVRSIPIRELRFHPDNERLFGSENADDRAKLDADIKARGQQNPIVICGKGCARPRGTIIRGNRRAASLARLGFKEALVIEIDDLDEEAIVELLVSDNLAGDCARRLSEEQRFNLEEECRKALGRKRGQRTDLEGSVTGDTDVLVAKQLGVGATAVRNRRKVFGSPASPEVVRTAVKSGGISVGRGATLVRGLEKGRTSLSRLEEVFARATSVGRISEVKEEKAAKGSRRQKEPPAKVGAGDGDSEELLAAALAADAAVGALRAAALRAARANVTRADALVAGAPSLSELNMQAAIALKSADVLTHALRPALSLSTSVRSLLAQMRSAR